MKDIRLWRRALAQNWDVPQKKRRQIVNKLCGALGTSKDDNLKLRCAEFLVAANAKNVRAATAAIKSLMKNKRDRIA